MSASLENIVEVLLLAAGRPMKVDEIVELEELPFLQPGPEGTDVVVWLVAEEKRAAVGAEDGE